jgi:hypothetical protein
VAQTGQGLDVRLDRDPRPGALSSALAVNLKVTVTERGTGAVPAADFEVFAFAASASGAKTEIFPCAQEHGNSPGVLRGVYVCTVLIDHGGRWRFSAVVNQRRADPADPPVALGRAENEFDIDTGEVAAAADTQAVKGRAFEVALLWSHTAAAGAWLVLSAVISALALPSLRRRLSPFGLHRLEDRFDLLVTSTRTATGLLIASGTYLLLNQTAYDTPFSSSSLDAVFRLPYGRPYFLTLAAKLGVYAMMLTASLLLLREARRRLRAIDAVPPEWLTDSSPSRAAPPDASPWRARPQSVSPRRATPPDAAAGGQAGTVTAVSALPVTDAETAVSMGIDATGARPVADTDDAAPASIRLGARVLGAGTVALSLSITLLKYFHELIEAARAAL